MERESKSTKRDFQKVLSDDSQINGYFVQIMTFPKLTSKGWEIDNPIRDYAIGLWCWYCQQYKNHWEITAE